MKVLNYNDSNKVALYGTDQETDDIYGLCEN